MTVDVTAAPFPQSEPKILPLPVDIVLVNFEENDPEYPYNWSGKFKWLINLVSALTMMTGLFSISSYTSGVARMHEEFGTSVEVLMLGQTLFLLGLGIGAMLFPATAGYFGRRRVVLSTMLAFTLFSVGVAAAQDIPTVMICRFLAGFFASASQVIGSASVSSLWRPRDLAVPFVTAAIAPFLGPSLGPLLSNYVVEYTGSWRNANWLSCGMAGLFTVLFFLIVPETFAPYILRRKAKALNAKSDSVQYVSALDAAAVPKSVSAVLSVYLARPFKFLLFEPVVTILTLYLSFLYGILNLFFEAFPFIYQIQRGWSQGNAGLPFMAIIAGYFIAIPVTILCGIPYRRSIEASGRAEPELRLIIGLVASVALPISLFWIAWTAAPSIPWPAPVVAGSVFGLGQIGLQMSAFTYLADIYGVQVGAAFAAMNFSRFSLASFFPLFARQMYDNLRTSWATSILGFILLAFMPAPFAFYHFGPRIRAWKQKKSERAPEIKA